MQWSRGYENLRLYVRFAFWLTHKRIIVTGLDNIPTDKPVIFAANHQNALMDPLALVCTNPLQTLWLTRADIFKSKAVAGFLRFLKMIPIYRIRDGKDNLTNNEEIFNQVTLTLESKQSVALFPEAAHSGRRQMLSHKKAIPRIAFETEEKNDFHLDLQVVPVGIFYDHYWKFNRTLLVQYGEPIEIDSYKDRFAENQQNAMLSLRDEIHERLAPLVIQINSIDHYIDYENLRVVAGKEYAKKTFFSNNPVVQIFRAEKELIAKVEKLEAGQPEVFKKVKDTTHSYIKTIRTSGITDEQLVKALNTPLPLLLVQFFGALLALPVFLSGLLTNAFPYLIPRLFITRKLKDKAFVSSFNFAVGLVLFPVFYLVEFGLIWIFSGSFPAALISTLLMPFAGKAAFNLLLFYQDLLQVLRLKLVNRKLFFQCKNLRSDLIRTVEMHISF